MVAPGYFGVVVGGGLCSAQICGCFSLPAAVWQQICFALIAQSKIHNQLKLSALLLAMRSKSNLYPHDYS